MMTTYPSMQAALHDQSDFLTQAMWAFHDNQIDHKELRYRMVSCATVLSNLALHAGSQAKKEARGGFITVTFDTEGRELPDLFGAVPRLMNLLRNTEAALGMVADHLAGLDGETVPAAAQAAVPHLAGQALRASMDADFGPVSNLHRTLLAVHCRHLEAKNALVEGGAGMRRPFCVKPRQRAAQARFRDLGHLPRENPAPPLKSRETPFNGRVAGGAWKAARDGASLGRAVYPDGQGGSPGNRERMLVRVQPGPSAPPSLRACLQPGTGPNLPLVPSCPERLARLDGTARHSRVRFGPEDASSVQAGGRACPHLAQPGVRPAPGNPRTPLRIFLHIPVGSDDPFASDRAIRRGYPFFQASPGFA